VAAPLRLSRSDPRSSARVLADFVRQRRGPVAVHLRNLRRGHRRGGRVGRRGRAPLPASLRSRRGPVGSSPRRDGGAGGAPSFWTVPWRNFPVPVLRSDPPGAAGPMSALWDVLV